MWCRNFNSLRWSQRLGDSAVREDVQVYQFAKPSNRRDPETLSQTQRKHSKSADYRKPQNSNSLAVTKPQSAALFFFHQCNNRKT